MSTPEVGIIGGGVGGLSAAIALAPMGVRPVVCERAAGGRAGGGALIMWCNALRALGHLDLQAAMMAVPTAQPVETSEFRRTNGEFITRMQVGAVSRRHHAESIVVARRDLIGLLQKSAARVAELRLGLALQDFTHDGDGVTARFSDGSERRFAALVGADGLGSLVRRQLGLTAPAREAEQELWVGTTRHRPSGLEPGRTIATVGAGARFWHALLGDGRAFWYATLSRKEAPPIERVADLARQFAGWHAPIPELLAESDDADAVHTRMRDREPSLPWGAGRVTLLGDAAHPMTPDLGQGACQAIESAVVLGQCLRPDKMAASLREYERRRFARTANISRMSWLVAHTSSVSSPFLCKLRDAAMGFGLSATFNSQLGWLLGGGC